MNPKPLITDTYLAKDGTNYRFEYFETDSFDHLPHNECRHIHGFAFLGDKIIVVNNVTRPNSFGPVGGGVDEGESPDDALIREIKEESNMKVLYFQPIGYQTVTDTSGEKKPYYQLRYFCVVEPFGPFESDPAGDVTEIFEVDPMDHKKYFDWGEKSQLIIRRALELKAAYDRRT